MSRYLKLGIAICALLWLPSLAIGGEKFNVVGDYTCTGDGYTATVKITAFGDAFKVLWKFSDDTTETGLGIFSDNALSLSWLHQDGSRGVAVYKVSKDKLKLEGLWAQEGKDGKVGTETFTKVKKH